MSTVAADQAIAIRKTNHALHEKIQAVAQEKARNLKLLNE